MHNNHKTIQKEFIKCDKDMKSSSDFTQNTLTPNPLSVHYAAKMQLPIFASRLNDYQLILNLDLTEPLIAEFSSFTETNADKFGGARSWGGFLKEGKLYYLAPHNPIEYASLEVILALGINTPKSIIVAPERKGDKLLVATEGIVEYWPIKAFRHEQELSPILDKGLSKIREQYKLDIKKQVIIDLISKKEYKINGNLFGADIAAILTQDEDFQPAGYNIGFVKVGNRFYASVIDKEKTSFSPPEDLYKDNPLIDDDGNPVPSNKPSVEKYYALRKKTDPSVFTDELFRSRLLDQELFIVYQIAKALDVSEDKKNCAFDKIFLNPRTIAAVNSLFHKQNKSQNKILKSLCDNLKIHAESILLYYKMRGFDLDKFIAREELRKNIAKKVVMELKFEGDSRELEKIIVEDLRAPYYRHFFINGNEITSDDLENQGLIKAIVKDIREDFNLAPKIAAIESSLLSSTAQIAISTNTTPSPINITTEKNPVSTEIDSVSQNSITPSLPVSNIKKHSAS